MIIAIFIFNILSYYIHIRQFSNLLKNRKNSKIYYYVPFTSDPQATALNPFLGGELTMSAKGYGNEVEVIVGSRSDLKHLTASKLPEVFKACEISYGVQVLSTHRHRTILIEHCDNSFEAGTRIFIALAGWAAQLAGSIASQLEFEAIVIGVPLPGGPYSPHDSLYSIASMPPRVVRFR